MFETILVAIGANLPSVFGRSARETCDWAAGQLAVLPGLRLRAQSRWFETRPIPESDQPSFINGAAWLSGPADPAMLLTALHGIEASAGRSRSVANAARTLDLDLLAMDGLVQDGPPILPHPRLQDRAFVLWPIADICPDWRHPVLGLNLSDMLRRVAGQTIQAL